MPITFKTEQFRDLAVTAAKIANTTITPGKVDLTQTFDFSSGLLRAATPSGNSDVATKSYVDGVAAGLFWKDPVRVATTANITLSGTQTIDGVAISAGQRVLVKSQSSAAENGIYVCAAGAWSRSTDMDAGAEFPSAAVFVSEGSVNADVGYVCTNDAAPNVGSDAIAFVQFTGLGSITAGAGLKKNGSTIAVAQTALGGLTFSASGDAGTLELSLAAAGGIELNGGQLRIKEPGSNGLVVDANGIAVQLDTNPGLELGANGVKVKVNASNPGIALDGAGLAVLLDSNSGLQKQAGGVSINLDTNPGLELGAGGLKVDLVTNSGLQTDANGLGVNLDTNSGLALAAGGVSINLDTNPGLQTGAGGVKVKIAASNPGLGLDANGLAVLLQANKGIGVAATGLQVLTKNGIQIDGTDGNLKLNLDGSSLAESASGVKVADDGIQVAQQGFRFRSDFLTGTDAQYTLANFVNSKNHDGVRAFLNGQRIRKVGSSPSDVFEYTVANDGSDTKVTLGAAMASGDILTVDYISD